MIFLLLFEILGCHHSGTLGGITGIQPLTGFQRFADFWLHIQRRHHKVDFLITPMSRYESQQGVVAAFPAQLDEGDGLFLRKQPSQV